MFEAARIAPVAYRPPWAILVDERVAALAARPRRIAYFCEKPEATTFRYRVFNMVEALAADPAIDTSASWFHRGDLMWMDRFVDRADALVICRARYDAALARLLARARARGLPVLFDVDDLIFDPDHVHLVADAIDWDPEAEATWETLFARTARIGATLRLCDGVITTNRFLADRVEHYAPGLRTHVIPNFLNREQQALSRVLFEAKRASGFERDGRVHLGYFSGTATHNRDFAVAASALVRLLRRHPRLVLRVVGALALPDELLRHRDRIERHGLQDFLNLQRLVAEVEINVAPLQDNLFTNCKSELKYFEAAICGTLTVASPTFALERAIRDGENGILARAYEWETQMETALAIVHEPARYAAIAERAFTQTEAAYGWDRHARLIEATVFGTGGTAPAVAQGRAPARMEPLESRTMLGGVKGQG